MPDRKSADKTITDDAPSDENTVRDLYDDFSSQYEHAVSQWGYNAPGVVANYLGNNVPFEQSILDAGCGTGLSGAALARKGYVDITGIDLSPESVKLAHESGHYRAVRTLNLTDPLPYKTEQFGGVVCVGVLSYIPNAQPVLKELLRTLAPGGTLVFTQREDHYETFNSARLFDQLHATEQFDRLVETNAEAYLPNNPSFADTIGVRYFVWRKHL